MFWRQIVGRDYFYSFLTNQNIFSGELESLILIFTSPVCINISKDKTFKSQPKENKAPFGKHWNRMFQHQIGFIFFSSIMIYQWITTISHNASHCRQVCTDWAQIPCKFLYKKNKSQISCLSGVLSFLKEQKRNQRTTKIQPKIKATKTTKKPQRNKTTTPPRNSTNYTKQNKPSNTTTL